MKLACDRNDLKGGEVTTEADGLVETLAALELEGNAFRTTVLSNYLGLDGSTSDGRCANLYAVAFANEKDLVEGDFGIDCEVELLDIEFVAFLNAVLLTAGFDHCVGHGRMGNKVRPPGMGGRGDHHGTTGCARFFYEISPSFNDSALPAGKMAKKEALRCRSASMK